MAGGQEAVANPDIVALALRRIDAGLRGHIDPGRFPGSTVLVPLGPGGRPVVTESFRTVPVFSDVEALNAWTAPPVGFLADPELEPVVEGVGTVVMPGGIYELLAGGAWVVALNPAGPGRAIWLAWSAKRRYARRTLRTRRPHGVSWAGRSTRSTGTTLA